MKALILSLAALAWFAALPADAMVSVAVVDSLEEMPDHLKFRSSPASQDALINVWITIVEPNPDDVGIWASLTTRIDGKILSRASLVAHKEGEGFSVSFQMPKEAFDESSIMIAVRGKDLADIGFEIALKMFKPEE